MSVKPGTGSEHPRTLPKHPGTYLEQPGTPPEHHQNTPEYPGAKKISNTKNLKIIPVNNQHVLSVTEKKKVRHMGRQLTLFNDFCSSPRSRFYLVFAMEERCVTFALCEINKEKITLILGTRVFLQEQARTQLGKEHATSDSERGA